MSSPTEFIIDKNGGTETVPACTINIENGEPSYVNQQLILEDGLIRETKPVETAPDLYVTPGFINCHMHFMMNGDATPLPKMLEDIARDPVKKGEEAIEHARNTLKLGVTFGWDKGPPGINALYSYTIMRRAAENGVPMTRFIYCPWAVVFDGGFASPFGRVLGSDKELNVILMEVAASGATSLKFIPETFLNVKDNSYKFLISPELFQATAKKAKEQHILIAVHAKGVDSIDQCIAADVECLEHAIQATDEQMKTIQEKDIYFGPTLYGLECRLEHAKKANAALDMAQYEWDAVCEMVGRAAKLNDGKPFRHMLFSSDAGSYTTPHASIRELYLMRKYGYPAASVFEAATVNGAKCAKQPQMGSIEPGKYANLIYWKTNPLELPLDQWQHLENHIAAVVLEGKVV